MLLSCINNKRESCLAGCDISEDATEKSNYISVVFTIMLCCIVKDYIAQNRCRAIN